MTLFELDPTRRAVEDALATLERGEVVVERQRIDLKEEAGRREKGTGRILPGTSQSPAAIDKLAPEVACMANTPGGGALLVGVQDDSTLIGTQLDEEWVRSQLYRRLQRRLTVDVSPVIIRGVRLLAIVIPEALEPIRHDNRLTWRVADNCEEIDATTWHAHRRHGLRSDWSAEVSGRTIDDVREGALEVARDFLRASPDSSANDLAAATRHDLLRRLNAVDGADRLTNAGALAFVGRGEPSLDYVRREHAGDDSTARVRRSDRSLLEELRDVFQTATAHNPVTHVAQGLAHGQVRQIPERALREAVVNGVAHREWSVAEPTTVEHTGGTLTVTSPGGFVTDVTADNIINHPSSSRNTALVELLASLRVAEREGVGVDRMYGDMLRIGCPEPDIRETEARAVRTTLIGNNPALGWRVWLASLSTDAVRDDLRLLMAVARLVEHGWVDENELAPYLQVTVVEARDTLRTLLTVAIGESPVVIPVAGTPNGSPSAYALSAPAKDALARADAEAGYRRRWPSREEIALSFARARGRISSTELASIVGASAPNVGAVLAALAEDGNLFPSRPVRRGAGFHYLADAPATAPHDEGTTT